MIVVIGIMAYIAIAAAQAVTLEKMFDYDSGLAVAASIIWPLTAPLLFVKYAIAKLLERMVKQ